MRNVIENDNPELPKKGKVLGHYEKGEVPVKFMSKVEEYYRQIFLSSDWYGCQQYS